MPERNSKYCSRLCMMKYQDRSRAKSGSSKNWLGDDAGYSALHKRVYDQRGRADHCEVCGMKDPDRVYNWANLTGHYEDVDDYAQMCIPCHHYYDGKTIPPLLLERRARGEQHGSHKLTEETAREAYRRVVSGETQYGVACDLGVDSCTINDLIRGRTWKHLNLEPLPAGKRGRHGGNPS